MLLKVEDKHFNIHQNSAVSLSLKTKVTFTIVLNEINEIYMKTKSYVYDTIIIQQCRSCHKLKDY